MRKEHESVIMECLSQTQIVTNLPRLQNTTFQTCNRSKYSPIIPRLIFKVSFPSLLPPQIPEPRATERETEEMRGAFKSVVSWVVGSVSGNLSHPVYAGQISAGNRRELAGPPLGHSFFLSFLSVPCLLCLRIWVCEPFSHRLLPISTLKPRVNRHTSGLAARRVGRRNRNPDEKESFFFSRATKRGQITHLLQIWMSEHRFNGDMLSYLQCPMSRKFQQMKRSFHYSKERGKNPGIWFR